MASEIAENMGLQGSSRFIAFLDECGDHSMEKIDQDFPLFVLCTVIVERERYIQEIIPSLNQLKLCYWDHEGINLHSRDIRKTQGPFSILEDPRKRDSFMLELTDLMDNLPYTLFVVSVHKQLHRQRYEERARNPYELALTFTFERILYFLEQLQKTHLPVIAEARGKNEDRDLETAFYKLLTEGTHYNSRDRFNRLYCPLLFQDKRKNICGLQLADLCAYPSARHILKSDQPNRALEVVKKHVYNENGVSGWKEFP